MTKLDSVEFFKNGDFSCLPFGTDRQLVISFLGEPDWISGNEESSVIRYDQIEFYFHHFTSGLKLLDGVVFLPTEESIKEVDGLVNRGWLSRDLNYEQVKRHLNSLQVKYSETVSEADSQAKVLRTSGGVDFLFFPEDQQICKAGRFL